MNYQQIAKNVVDYFNSLITKILQNIDHKLLITINDRNILLDTNNILESSTALGFLVEEYISLLLIQTSNVLKINRPIFKTNVSSYDLETRFDNVKILINIKIEKHKNRNQALSAIQNLYKDYVVESGEKLYLIIKLIYKIENNAILITNFFITLLEQLNLEKSHQDYRSWSKAINKNSGRLMINKKVMENIIEINKISFEFTKKQIEKIYKANIKK